MLPLGACPHAHGQGGTSWGGAQSPRDSALPVGKRRGEGGGDRLDPVLGGHQVWREDGKTSETAHTDLQDRQHKLSVIFI